MYRHFNIGAYLRTITFGSFPHSVYDRKTQGLTQNVEIVTQGVQAVIPINSRISFKDNSYSVDVDYHYLTTADKPTANLMIVTDNSLWINAIAKMMSRLPDVHLYGTTTQTVAVGDVSYDVSYMHMTTGYFNSIFDDFSNFLVSMGYPQDTKVLILGDFNTLLEDNEIDKTALSELHDKTGCFFGTLYTVGQVAIDDKISEYNEYIRKTFNAYEWGSLLHKNTPNFYYSSSLLPYTQSQVNMITPISEGMDRLGEMLAGLISLYFKGVESYEFI